MFSNSPTIQSRAFCHWFIIRTCLLTYWFVLAILHLWEDIACLIQNTPAAFSNAIELIACMVCQIVASDLMSARRVFQFVVEVVALIFTGVLMTSTKSFSVQPVNTRPTCYFNRFNTELTLIIIIDLSISPFQPIMHIAFC